MLNNTYFKVHRRITTSMFENHENDSRSTVFKSRMIMLKKSFNFCVKSYRQGD